MILLCLLFLASAVAFDYDALTRCPYPRREECITTGCVWVSSHKLERGVCTEDWDAMTTELFYGNLIWVEYSMEASYNQSAMVNDLDNHEARMKPLSNAIPLIDEYLSVYSMGKEKYMQ